MYKINHKHKKNIYTIYYIHADLPARGLGNGLNSDDLDDDEEYNDDELDVLFTLGNGRKSVGLPIRTTDDSRYQSMHCMY